MELGKIEQVKEHPLTDEQLLTAKDDIELLVKLICYIGADHPKAEEIANHIYNTWSETKQKGETP